MNDGTRPGLCKDKGGPEGVDAPNPALDQHTPTPKAVPAMPEIMPPTGPLVDRFLRPDGCPECVTNVVMPYRVAIEDHGFTAYYQCRPCRHHWSTGWGE